MTSQSPRSEPAACSSKRPLQRLPQSLCPRDDMATTFHPYFTFSQYSSAHRKVISAGLISLPFEQIICQSMLGAGILLVLWSTFSAVKAIYKQNDWCPVNRNFRKRIEQSTFFWGRGERGGEVLDFPFLPIINPKASFQQEKNLVSEQGRGEFLSSRHIPVKNTKAGFIKICPWGIYCKFFPSLKWCVLKHIPESFFPFLLYFSYAPKLTF